MRHAAPSVLTLLRRLGVWMLVPVFAALILYQPPGVEAGAGLAISPHSVAIIATSAKALAEKPAAPDARGRPLLATLVGGDDAPAVTFRVHRLRPCYGASALVQHSRIGWQARAPPNFLATTVI